jgi:F-type H+-transporting ATPase subunit delta
VANERPSQIYAQAVYEKAVASWLDPLKTITASLVESGMIDNLDDAGVPFSKKQEMLRSVFPADTENEVQNLVFLLASKNEVNLLPEIVKEFERFVQRTEVMEAAKVTSAVPLLDAEKQTLETKLRKQFGNEIIFDYLVDPAILGGVIVRAGDKVIDGSVSGKLAALKEKLK